jgi:hypothetical protein
MVAVFFSLGLMAKPMLVTLPFVLLLLDYWPLGRMEPAAGNFFPSPRRVVAEKLPLLALTIASCVATFFAQGNTVVPVDVTPLSSRIASALVSYVAYIGKFLCPVGLGRCSIPIRGVVCQYGKSSLPPWRWRASRWQHWYGGAGAPICLSAGSGTWG